MSNPLDPHAAIVTEAAGLDQGGTLRTADGQPLTKALARSSRRARRRAFLLVLPLLLFVLLTFVLPIGQMLQRSVKNDGFSANMPELSAWFDANPDAAEPDDAAWAALATDLTVSAQARTIGIVGTRINYDIPGTRSLFTSAGRKARGGIEPPYREAILEMDSKWGDPKLWGVMRQASSPYTANFYLAAMDRTRDEAGNIVQAPEQQRIYLHLFMRTFWLSLIITGTTFLLGFPIAHLLATLPMRKSNLLMILVLLPFWTSLLVRTTAWMVLLQQQGVVNDVLVWLGVIGDNQRLQMIFNQTGTIIAMTHILLPFMILPLYSVMRTINPSYVRAARSLGATSWTAFRRIYFPQTLNWSMAAALAAMLLGGVLILYWVYDRLVGIDNLKLG